MNVAIYNTQKNKIDEMSVPGKFFGAKWNDDLVHQAVVTHEANARNIVAHAKDRSEVRGGGKKPWKQKGTGRSRHGSIRSPLWKGGGATHGPLKMKVYAKKMNKKMKQAALYAVLSQKLNDNKLFVISELPIGTTIKTKVVLPVIKLFAPKSALVVASQAHKDVHRACKNVAKLAYAPATSLNAYEALKADTIIFEKEALEEFIKHISKEKKTA